jgi:hypothetical protein
VFGVLTISQTEATHAKRRYTMLSRNSTGRWVASCSRSAAGIARLWCGRLRWPVRADQHGHESWVVTAG